MLARTLLLFLTVTCSVASLCQDASLFKPDSIKKELNAMQITGNIRVDGILNDPEWKLAQLSPRFIQIEPYQDSLPSFDTDVKVLYNRQYLYFGIFSHDSLGKKAIRATDFKRDFSAAQHDLVSIAFDCFNDSRNSMVFATNPFGVQRDLLSFDDLYFDTDWNGLWRVRTSRTDSGWYAEIAIPWQTLRYPKKADTLQRWGLNIYRNRRLTNEISAFSAYPRSMSAARMDYAGVLKNLQPPPPKPNIRFQPFVLSSFDHYSSIDSSGSKQATKYKVGGDIKWAVNSNTVVDLTVNTDFAQADADQQVNNVTRFSVFFPEKRQFFLESASLFGIGIGPSMDGSGGQMRVQPFFSRTIGLDANGAPIPIDAGGRFVNRSSKRNFGAILIRQHPEDNNPATNFFVGRYSENLGTQNRIGALVTVKDRPGGTNIVTTVDGFFRLGDSHSLNTMFTQSATTNGGKNGFAGLAQYVYTTNQVKAWFTQSVVTKNFDPEMGFVSRTDVIGTTPGINWYYRGSKLPFKKILRAFEPGFLPEFYWQASTGKMIERTLTVFPLWFNFQNGAYLGYALGPSFQRLTETFTPLGVPIQPGDYNYINQQIWIGSNPSAIISVQGVYTWGSYFDGRLHSGDWKLQFAPIPNISLTARYNRNRFMDVGQPKTSTTVDLYGIEGRFALNPRLQLTGFYQRNTRTNFANYNVRLSWEYKPLSYVYIVLNHAAYQNIQLKTQSEDHVIAKISYLRQF